MAKFKVATLIDRKLDIEYRKFYRQYGFKSRALKLINYLEDSGILLTDGNVESAYNIIKQKKVPKKLMKAFLYTFLTKNDLTGFSDLSGKAPKPINTIVIQGGKFRNTAKPYTYSHSYSLNKATKLYKEKLKQYKKGMKYSSDFYTGNEYDTYMNKLGLNKYSHLDKRTKLGRIRKQARWELEKAYQQVLRNTFVSGEIKQVNLFTKLIDEQARHILVSLETLSTARFENFKELGTEYENKMEEHIKKFDDLLKLKAKFSATVDLCVQKLGQNVGITKARITTLKMEDVYAPLIAEKDVVYYKYKALKQKEKLIDEKIAIQRSFLDKQKNLYLVIAAVQDSIKTTLSTMDSQKEYIKEYVSELTAKNMGFESYEKMVEFFGNAPFKQLHDELFEAAFKGEMDKGSKSIYGMF